jgi:hypothetical protein
MRFELLARRTVVVFAVLALVATLAAPAPARAEGDPGSLKVLGYALAAYAISGLPFLVIILGESSEASPVKQRKPNASPPPPPGGGRGKPGFKPRRAPEAMIVPSRGGLAVFLRFSL